ncbi:AAA family ATPase [Micromonospora sp. NPDC049891]|uniref:AAA family ATPase n=1 Tax=Micromonospora sp. NPDC049891 TaxID=3155655 RepID=UPI0033FF8E08
MDTEDPADKVFLDDWYRALNEPGYNPNAPVALAVNGTRPKEEQDEPPPNRFAAQVIRRSALRSIPPIEPLIDGILSRRATAVLVGSYGSGKTFLALALACAVGTGRDWLGRAVKRCPVLYIVGEGAAGLDARITAWEQAWNAGQPIDDGDVIFVVRPGSIASPHTWADILAFAIAHGVGLIILDTLSSLGPDVDETKDAATITRRMADLADAIDGTVLLVHHPGWSDDGRTRGGYQWEANTDEVLVLHGTAKSPELRLERKKVKDGEAGPPILLRRKAAHGSCVIEGVAAQERAQAVANNAEAIARAVFGDGTFTRAQLRDALVERMSVSATTAYEYINGLSRDGLLRAVTGRGRNTQYRMEGRRP